MAKGIIIPLSVQAKNVDALNKTFVSTDNIENGSIFTMGTINNDGLYNAVKPATATLANETYMACSPERVITVLPDGTKFVGLTEDPRAFENVAGQPIDAIALKVGDKVRLSTDAVAGTKSTNTLVTATNNAYKLTWAESAGDGLTLKYVADSYISIGTGVIGSQRIASYDFIVVKA